MSSKKIILVVVIVLLVAGNFYLGFRCFSLRKDFYKMQSEIKEQDFNSKVLDFTKLFIDEVLKSNSEIDFETRLKLENAVRGLNDQEILDQWQKFVNSKTETEAQSEVKNLLDMLVNKIKI